MVILGCTGAATTFVSLSAKSTIIAIVKNGFEIL